MLIRERIARAVSNGDLFPVKPIAPWSGAPRGFLLCKPLREAIESGKASDSSAERHRWATLEAAMSYFVEGHPVSDGLIKQLLPQKYEHWELRSRSPKPSMRVFGRFAAYDIFVGTHVRLRTELGGMWSQQFEHEKLVCEDHWKAAGLLAPFSDSPTFKYEAYMSNASKNVRVK
jgi:hypothetical protein